jgi:monoamine oxidase
VSPTTSATPGTSVPARARVAVIGAGMAGLACAVELTSRGFDVIVIEARDRIGGRICTSHVWGDVPIDLGASWIHGTIRNPIADLARRANVRTVSTSYDSSELHISERLRAAGLRRSDSARWQDLIDEAAHVAQTSDRDLSMGAAIRLALDGHHLSAIERADMAFYLNSAYESEWGLMAEQLSARTADDAESFDGEDVLFPGGYEAIPAYLARGLQVRTGEHVHQIRHDASGAAVVTDQAEHAVAAVVVTVPIAVLRSGAITITPMLPDATQAAAEAVGVGVLGKTFLRFSTTFWPVDTDWHEYLSEENRWTEWVSFAKAGASVLLGFTVGEHGSWMESAPEHDVVEQSMVAVRAMFGTDAPSPIAVQRSAWANDPLALGSYSGNAVGTTRGHRADLAAPQGARLFLAGEATEPDYFGTVHGAYFSGIRAALQVRDALTR